ncbi:MAG: hypothetical protein GC159_10525 [Phycisphaera sp.]|nr:hypothetical protein [Phycisphaera sp.]
MKWSNPIVAVSLTLALIGGCERNPTDAQHEASQKALAKALEQTDQAIAGVRELKNEDVGKIETREQYRQTNLAEATKTLKEGSVLQGVKPAHIVAARSLKSGQLSSTARLKIRDASVSWTHQGPTTVMMISDLSGIRLARTRATANEAVAYKSILEDMQKKISDLRAMHDKIMGEMDPLTKGIADLKAQVEKNDAARRQKIAEADKNAREAFKSTGKQRFDLEKVSLEATREADKLTAQSDLAAANLDIDEAKLKIFNARLADVDLQIKQLTEATESLQQREKDTDKLAADARTHAEELLKRFDENLAKLAKVHEEQVTANFTAANSAYEEAIDDLDTAAKQAEPDYRISTKISLNAARAEYGMSLREEAQLHASYRDLLKDLATGAEKEVSERKQTLDDMAAAADKLSTEMADKAKEVLDAADAELTDMAETVSDKKLKQAVLRQIIEVNMAMAKLSDDAKYPSKVDTYKTKLRTEEAG